MNENSYGFEKRLNFINAILRKYKISTVLDIGCGTGENVSMPLSKLFPAIQFFAVDSDRNSIEYAKSINPNANLKFMIDSELNANEKFDLIIASEVLEHVVRPIEFLDLLREKLSTNGRMILTLPNGYGPFEIASLIENFFYFFGGYFLIRTTKLFFSKKIIKTMSQDTLANSPHINFFSYSDVKKILSLSGWSVISFSARTFLCGFGFDWILRGKLILKWNARVADKIPPCFNSAWMFELAPNLANSNPVVRYKKNFYGRLRAYLNRLRWKI